MASDIPGARRMLREIAATLDSNGLSSEANSIRKIVRDKLYRAKQIKRAPAKSQTMSDAVRFEIIHLADLHPDWSNQKIANEVHVNPGRVSETLHGK